MAKKRKLLSDSQLLYTNPKHGISIYIEQEILFFEIKNKAFNNLVSYDEAEVVAALLKLTDLKDKELWSIKLSKKTCDFNKTFYWLLGGDKEWLKDKHFISDWNDVIAVYSTEYLTKFNEIISKAKTLNDIRNNFIKHFNLPELYEFALDRKMIK
jgi:hypothetical protein